MNIFFCEARLSTIRKKSDAAEIIQLLRDQETSIRYFAYGSTTKLEPSQSKDRLNSFDYTLVNSTNPLLNVTVVLTEGEAIDKLWKDRKYYNMRGRE